MADGPDKWRTQTHETADHSIPYSAGLALMYGKIDPDYYEDPDLHKDPWFPLVKDPSEVCPSVLLPPKSIYATM